MLGAFHLPQSGLADVQIFNRPSTVSGVLHQSFTWHKPRGKSMLYIYCRGGGGGGGGGLTGAAAAARGGGGSGGSAGFSCLFVPLFMIPSELYVHVGAGGVGGTSGVAGGSGLVSQVRFAPYGLTSDDVPLNCLIRSQNGLSGGGSAGTGTAGGAAGAAATVANVNGGMPHATHGIWRLNVGLIGATGGDDANGPGSGKALGATSLCSIPGTGGGGTTSADTVGGAFTALADALISERRPAPTIAATPGAPGSGGGVAGNMHFLYGGLGGGGSNTGVGGEGGNGGPGTSGGGGGGGTTGGKGGDGGAGLVIMVAW
jgi:hypothetical protein